MRGVKRSVGCPGVHGFSHRTRFPRTTVAIQCLSTCWITFIDPIALVFLVKREKGGGGGRERERERERER